MRRRNSEPEAQISPYEKDFTTLWTALHEEAERREWCDTYDAFVARVNTDLVHKIPTRPQVRHVNVTYSVISERNHKVTDHARLRVTAEIHEGALTEHGEEQAAERIRRAHDLPRAYRVVTHGVEERRG